MINKFIKQCKDVILQCIKHRAFLICCGCILLLPFLFLSFYCHPIGDDFTYAHKGMSQPFFYTLLDEYIHWNGRYSSNVFVILNPIVFNSFIGYKWIPIVTILMLLGVIYISIKESFKHIDKATHVLLAMAITLLYCNITPSLAQAIYWYTGNVTYTFGIISFILLYYIMLRKHHLRYVLNNKKIHDAILYISTIATIGFNETIMIFVCFFTCIYLFYNFYNNKHITISDYIHISCILVASIVVIFAPGNATRSENYPLKNQILHSVLYSTMQVVRFSTVWLIAPASIIASTIYWIYILPTYKLYKHHIIQFFNTYPLLNVLSLLASIYIGTFPPYITTGILGQHRSVNVSCFFFILFWFILLSVLYIRLPQYHINRSTKRVFMFFVLFGLTLISTSNGFYVMYDLLSGNAKKMNDTLNKRYEMIHTNEKKITFQRVDPKPKSIFVLDITKNPKHWINKGYTIYFNKKDMEIYQDSTTNSKK